MTIPIYDTSTLPIISLPLKDTKTRTMRYLGNRGITGDIQADVELKASSDSQVAALYIFWKDECNYGLEPFIMPLPIFGRPTDVNAPDLLVMFTKESKDTKTQGQWSSKRTLKILGKVVYTINIDGDFILSDEGQFTLDDNGNYIALTSRLHTNKEIYYGIG